MSDEPLEPTAWQPFTPRGVARFASATWGRLLLVQVIVALFVAACVIWFIRANYSPIIAQAITHLGEDAKLNRGKIENVSPGVLADGRFLSIVSNFGQTADTGVGDVQLLFEPDEWRVCSFFGCLFFYYPGGTHSLARSDVEPWWGAWQPAILTSIGAAVLVKLLFVWAILGIVYFWIPKLIAFFADRDLSLIGSWKLASAAQLPGALFAALMILLYGMQAFDLLRFLIFYALHMVVSLVYVVASPFLLPRTADVKPNPFVGGAAS